MELQVNPTELVNLEALNQQDEEALFVEGADLTPLVNQVEELAADLPTDMSVKKNRKAVSSLAYKVARVKSRIDKRGLAVSKKYKEIPKMIDMNRRGYRSTLETLQDEVKANLTAWEQAEQERKDAIQTGINRIREYAEMGDNLSEVNDYLKTLDETAVSKETFAEFEADALKAKEETRQRLLARQAAFEAELAAKAKAEAERLEREAKEREEREARIRQEEAERVRREEAERIRKETEATLRQEQQQAASAAKANAPAQSAAPAVQAAPPTPTQPANPPAAPASQSHDRRKEVNNAIKDAIQEQCFLDEAAAKAVVIALAKGKIPHIHIDY